MAKIKYEAPVITDMDSRLLFDGLDVGGESGRTQAVRPEDKDYL